jgi:hypothetical protein
MAFLILFLIYSCWFYFTTHIFEHSEKMGFRYRCGGGGGGGVGLQYWVGKMKSSSAAAITMLNDCQPVFVAQFCA